MCHVSIFKPYPESCTTRQSYCGTESNAVLALSSAGLREAVTDECDHFNFPSPAVVHGRLKNAEISASLDLYFTDQNEAQQKDVIGLIKANVPLFSDVHTRTPVLTTNSPPIKHMHIWKTQISMLGYKNRSSTSWRAT